MESQVSGFFKILTGQVRLRLDTNPVELSRERVKGAEWGDVEYQYAPYPPLPFKRTLGRYGPDPLFREFRCPLARFEPWQAELG